MNAVQRDFSDDLRKGNDEIATKTKNKKKKKKQTKKTTTTTTTTTTTPTASYLNILNQRTQSEALQ